MGIIRGLLARSVTIGATTRQQLSTAAATNSPSCFVGSATYSRTSIPPNGTELYSEQTPFTIYQVPITKPQFVTFPITSEPAVVPGNVIVNQVVRDGFRPPPKYARKLDDCKQHVDSRQRRPGEFGLRVRKLDDRNREQQNSRCWLRFRDTIMSILPPLRRL